LPSARAAGVSYIAEDRHRTASGRGRAARWTIWRWAFHRNPPLASRGLPAIKGHAGLGRGALIRKFDVKISSEATLVGTLSGGNLQKIVIARELSHQAPRTDRRAADAPASDVGAIEFIHAELVGRAR